MRAIHSDKWRSPPNIRVRAALMLLWVVCLSGATQNAPIHAAKKTDVAPENGPEYAGDATCISCHKEIVSQYSQTAHRITSSLPTKESIGGSDEPGKNRLTTSNPDLHFVMSSSDAGFYQSAVTAIPGGGVTERKERIAFVIGSGRKGQTYLYWSGDRLFQLPVSYWAELGRWINSPGFPDGTAHFDRPVVARCLECHSSYFEAIPSAENAYKTEGMRLGVTCEKCHGPGSLHMALNRSDPHIAKNAPQSIINPAKLTRDRQIDGCALCHAGTGISVVPPFSFGPGDILADFIYLHKPDPDERIDVHGNQVEPLKRSLCFRSSSMTCSTCHNVHQVQRDAASFSEKCLGCHKPQSCGKFSTLGPSIAKDCVSCHMPLQESQTLIAYGKEGELRPKVRSHQIAVYSTSFHPQTSEATPREKK